AVDAALRDVGAVVHLAAQVGVGQSMYTIGRYVTDNAVGTAVLLDRSVNGGPGRRRLGVAPSVAVYRAGRPRCAAGAVGERVLRLPPPPLVAGDGRQSRDFVHVSDIVPAFSLALARTDVADVNLNVGTGRATSVVAIARGLGRALGVPLDPEILGRFREGDIRHCVADITRTQRLLGYVPRVRLEEGLAELAEWSRSQAPEDRVEQARTELEDKRLIR